MNLILASSSKDRQNLFNLFNFKYRVVKSLEEEYSENKDPREYVKELSYNKAENVSNQIDYSAVIVAADTIMYIDDKFFEKPDCLEEARSNMRFMSGKVVHAVTGVTIKDMYQNKVISFFDDAHIYMNDISEEEIEWYLNNEENILNCSGFSIDGKAGLFIDRIDGDYNTIIGISVSKVYSKLKELGYTLNDFK